MYRQKVDKCPLYPIWLCIIASDDTKKVNGKYDLGLDFSMEDGHTHRKGIKIPEFKTERVCIFIVLDPTNEQFSQGLIAHECLHATSYILDWVGIKPDYMNDEAQAYLMQYIFDQVNDFIKPYMK